MLYLKRKEDTDAPFFFFKLIICSLEKRNDASWWAPNFGGFPGMPQGMPPGMPMPHAASGLPADDGWLSRYAAWYAASARYAAWYAASAHGARPEQSSCMDDAGISGSAASRDAFPTLSGPPFPFPSRFHMRIGLEEGG